MRAPLLIQNRLINQQIASAGFATVKDLVQYMGALQAQDYSMAKWAIGLRLQHTVDQQVEKALDKGSILRTHVLRPTWHFISANDIYWMLSLSAGQIMQRMKTMDKQLGLTASIFSRSNNIIEKALGEGRHLTREVLAEQLQAEKINLANNRLSHLLVRAELEQITCSGQMQDGKRTYALLANRVKKKIVLPREEALTKLASVYFRSRGPASLKDFVWWSGLSITEAKKGLHSISSELASVTINQQVYYYSRHIHAPPAKTGINTVYLLPAFDEYILGYADRTAVLATTHQSKLLTRNGIFFPAIVVNGRVCGLWKKIEEKESVVITVEFFTPPDKSVHGKLEKKAAELGKFMGLPVVLKVQKKV
jgi:Winged helix DNA-binding domain